MGRITRRVLLAASRLLAAAVAIGLWEFVVRVFDVSELVVPRPSDVAIRLYEGLTEGGLLYNHLVVTTQEILLGFAIGAALGLVVGVALGLSSALERLLYPYIAAFNAVPKVAVTPLIVLWFGVGLDSKVIITALISFFPLLVNVITGLHGADPDELLLMRSLRASSWQTFTRVRLWRALPSVFAGLEIAVVLSVVGAIVGEFVGAREGLGYYILLSNSMFDTVGMFAAFVLLAAIGAFLSVLVKFIGRRVVFWQGVPDVAHSA